MNLASTGALAALSPTDPTALAAQLRPDPPWWLKHWPLRVHLPHERPGFFKHPPLPHPPVHPALASGMPGWQITLITLGAAALAAAAILLGRAVAARRQPSVASS